MAQLVKLLDYVSRYENDLTRYPTQFIRLKRHQWERMKVQWETKSSHTMWDKLLDDEVVEEVEEKKNFFSFLNVFGARKEELATEELEEVPKEEEFGFSPSILFKPKTIEELRKLYLDQLFHFQMKWASSTLMDRSRIDPIYMRDSLLRTFTQLLPDSFLLFYNPVIMIQKAPIELDIIIVTPVECMCITVLEAEDLAVFIGSGERFWLKKASVNETKLLNPLIALNRNEKVLKKLFEDNEVNFPIKKYLISRNGYIDYPNVSFDIKIIDKKSYDQWFASIRSITTPLKLAQFQASKAILDVARTTAMSRLFEEEDTEEKQEDSTF